MKDRLSLAVRTLRTGGSLCWCGFWATIMLMDNHRPYCTEHGAARLSNMIFLAIARTGTEHDLRQTVVPEGDVATMAAALGKRRKHVHDPL